ncbi:MAG TPA: PilN domain-containing protein [Gaiellaceae bacterium]|nr:PilN domain-containing protein [Gaiellaceae bacterium]
MRAVNLLPREAVREPRKIPSAVPLVCSLAVPVVAISLVIVGYSGVHADLAVKRAQLAALQASAATAAPAVSAEAITAESGLVSERTQRLAALQAALGKEVPWDVTLRDVARVIPAGVWLSSLNASSPAPADVVPAPDPAPAGSTTPAAPAPAPAPAPSSSSGAAFTMGGFAYTNEDVALLLRRLQLLPALGDVTLVSTTQTTTNDKTVVQFQITAVVQPLPAGSAQ